MIEPINWVEEPDWIEEMVRAEEDEATRALGFVPCPGSHVDHLPDGMQILPVDLSRPCPGCGAAL